MSPKIDIDPEHAVALAERFSLADKIRYACRHVEPPTTLGVKQWLAAYGVTITRAYATGIINTWRGENRIGDTGDLVAMSPELLAELDALRSHEPADPVPADENPTLVDLKPVTDVDLSTSTEPTGPAAVATPDIPSGASPDPDSDTVDTDRTDTLDQAAAATATATMSNPARLTVTDAVDTDDTVPAAPAETAVEQAADPTADVRPVATEAQAASVTVTTPAADTAPDPAPAEATPEPAQPTASNAIVVAGQAPAVQPVDYVEARAERVQSPLVEPAAPLTTQVPTVLSWSANMAWIVVLVAAMGISWWSLFEYARAFSIPTPLAAVVSLVFDASALIVAGLAHRYALSPYSGAGPRFALLALLAGSVYLNWEHAAGKGYGIEASIMFAAPAAVGILLFELHIGWHSRSERRARGRVARSLPVIGAWGWFLHPLQSVTTLWQVTHARGRSVREAELESIEQVRVHGH
ncbi:DUF2637 domain-containing protein [Actinokineospora enzanensis]|uniref:DUF2637 domain-containing protein n=1 Tax=Actinokineospora enzanensis TaxID=155975 RepID=UPI00039B40CA|nr:DUF2637 domain-containing protein [Actinokineospora enzanensis]